MAGLKTTLKFVGLCALTTILGGTALAQTNYPGQVYQTQTPVMYVVMFRADWCAPCKIVEPAAQQALQRLGDSTIEYVTIDISNPGLSEIGAHAAFDRKIVPQYNMWLGVTGFAAIIDGDTKQTLGCINMQYDVPSMTTHIRNLKTFATANQPSFDLTCPEANNPVTAY